MDRTAWVGGQCARGTMRNVGREDRAVQVYPAVLSLTLFLTLQIASTYQWIPDPDLSQLSVSILQLPTGPFLPLQPHIIHRYLQPNSESSQIPSLPTTPSLKNLFLLFRNQLSWLIVAVFTKQSPKLATPSSQLLPFPFLLALQSFHPPTNLEWHQPE